MTAKIFALPITPAALARWSSNMAANKALTTVHGPARSPRPKSLRPIAFSTAHSNTETVSRRTSCRTPLISCFTK
jgi:hypothetical protein